jgi:hypothetical protein
MSIFSLSRPQFRTAAGNNINICLSFWPPSTPSQHGAEINKRKIWREKEEGDEEEVRNTKEQVERKQIRAVLSCKEETVVEEQDRNTL